MLKESERERKEKAREVPAGLSLMRQLMRRTRILVVEYIIEPLATGFRFINLVMIFAPLILTIPVVCFGSRVGGNTGERSGTLWWYGFLIAMVDKAGPTFIKVGVSADLGFCDR